MLWAADWFGRTECCSMSALTCRVDSFAGEQIGACERDINQFPGNNEVEGVVFACVYLKRETLNTVGLLDEDYFSYFEDTDYCFRVKERGLRVVCCGSVRVIHHEHVSTRVNGVPQSKVFESAKAVFRRKWESKLRAERYSREIGWHSLMNFPTGYAISSRELATALDRNGVHVAYQVRVRSGHAVSAGRAGEERDEDGGDDSREAIGCAAGTGGLRARRHLL